MPIIRKVLIAGGGIGGLTLATALCRQGVEARVVELKPPGGPTGSGLAQPANALRALKTVGLLEPCLEVGFGLDAYVYFDPDGTLLAERKGPRLVGENTPSYNLIYRHYLHNVLTRAAKDAGADIRYETTITGLLDTADGVQAQLSDGTEDTVELVVGADGIRSSLRRRLFGSDCDPVSTDQACWRMLASRPKELSYGAVYLGQGVRVGTIPLADDMMYLFAISNENVDQHYAKDELPERLYALLEGFGGFVPAAREQARSSDSIVFTMIEEVLMPPPWHQGRVVIIGDAAHACGPQIAQGGAMAVEDAVVLAEEIAVATDITEMMRRFMTRRYERCKFVQHWSRQVGDQNRIVDSKACRERNDAIKRGANEPLRPHELRLLEPI
jgi:2-polyprenyl-6-methoxyphenol hydroxylase-like FAD-dependent oxidoreductase